MFICNILNVRVVDRDQTPYLLYPKLKEGNYPYFMAWVENDEMMIPSR